MTHFCTVTGRFDDAAARVESAIKLIFIEITGLK